MTNAIAQKYHNLSLLGRKAIEYGISSFDGDSLWCVSFETKNWGDWLNKPLIEKVTGKPVQIFHVNHLAILNGIRRISPGRPTFTAIGSIMHFAPDDSFIWGTGCVWDSKLSIKPSAILSVRGPLTADVLAAQGFEQPSLFGDPALLLEKYLPPAAHVSKRYALGVIPHHSEWAQPAIKAFQGMSDVRLIDIEGDQETLISQIRECECIFSSSLHGLILSDILQVPNAWVRFRAAFPGENFKFNDYYMSLNGNQSHRNWLVPHMLKPDAIDSALIKKISSEARPHEHRINLDSVEGVLLEHLYRIGIR